MLLSVKRLALVLKLSFFLFHTQILLCKTFLVFGGKSGWVGQKIATILRNMDHVVYCAKSRLEQRETIEQEIKQLRPDCIINTAGIIGRPTIDWCEFHKQETLRSNILGLLNLVDLAYLHNLHVTNIATGCIYQYDDKHPLGSGIGFSEEEEPNFFGSFYSCTKILAEKLILNYPNVLNLRLRMPISSDLSQKSFIGKIINYKKLINIPNSMSVLEDLLPLIPQMIERNLVGNYNFVNPGVISHNQIIELYKQYINPNHQYENFTIEEQNQILKVPRSNCELSAKKLLSEFPQIPHIQDSIRNVFLRIKTKENKQ
ncbi:MAG: NAD-dependent epimerase/dehydratase family protein [Candidatus Babeliales bacterium]